MQLLQSPGLVRNLGKQVGHLVLDIEPARRQQVHLDDHVAIVAVGDETSPLFRHGRVSVGCAIGGREDVAFGGMVGVRLAVGDVSFSMRSLAISRQEPQASHADVQVGAVPPHGGADGSTFRTLTARVGMDVTLW